MEPNKVQIREHPTAIASGVTVSELKVHLGLFGDSSQDAYLSELILSAEQAASDFIGHTIGETLKTAYWDGFKDELTIPDEFLIDGSDITLKYVRNDNTTVTVSQTTSSGLTLFVIDRTGDKVVLRKPQGLSYPQNVVTNLTFPVTIEYTAGFNSSQLSAILGQSVMMYCDEQYKNRGISTVDRVNKLPLSAERLLSSYRKVVL